jgi:hypothetical protein
MHYLMTDPLLVDDSALQRLLGRIAKTPYSEGVRQCVASAEVLHARGGAGTTRAT